MDDKSRPPVSVPRIVAGAVAGWLIFVSIDFLFHAVIFAGWWKATASYWLDPEELFRMIPFGYATFAIYCAVLTWLYVRIQGDRRSFGTAFRFGGLAGLIFGALSILANLSVFRLPLSSLLVWPASFLIESAVACVVTSWVLDAERPWRRVGLALAAALILIIVGVVLQNIIFPDNAGEVFKKG